MLIQVNHIPSTAWRAMKQWEPSVLPLHARSRIKDHLIILCDRPSDQVIERMDHVTPYSYVAVQAVAALPHTTHQATDTASQEAVRMLEATRDMLALVTGYYPGQPATDATDVVLAYGADPDMCLWVRNALGAIHPATRLYTFGNILRTRIGRTYHYHPRRIDNLSSTAAMQAVDMRALRRLKLDHPDPNRTALTTQTPTPTTQTPTPTTQTPTAQP